MNNQNDQNNGREYNLLNQEQQTTKDFYSQAEKTEKEYSLHNNLSSPQPFNTYSKYGKITRIVGVVILVSLIGFELLDASLILFTNEVLLEKDWKKVVEFETRWGKGMALESDAENVDAVGYAKGYVVVIKVSPKKKWRAFLGQASSKVDFTTVYQKLKLIDPESDWFLHHAKQMLMNGSRSSPNVVRSRLTMKELIGLVAIKPSL